jgi:hypothetical protein
MIPLSSNHFSVDNQIDSTVTYLTHAPELEREARQFRDAFPEYAHIVWAEHSSWIDAEASGVDPEFMSWVADWIEANTPIFWEEGEPWLPEPTDQSYEDYLSDEPDQHGIPDGLTREQYEARRPDLAGNWFDHVEQGGA